MTNGSDPFGCIEYSAKLKTEWGNFFEMAARMVLK